MDLHQMLQSAKLVPIVTLRNEKSIEIIKTVIEQSAIEIVEVAFRSRFAVKAIEKYALLNNVIVGAGTVRTRAQAEQAVEAGAKFLISPGYDPEIVKFAIDHNIPIIPGVLTPTEIMRGMSEAGLSVFKLFPANLIGGLSAIKALSGPFFDVKFLPTGGVNRDNYLEFLREKQVIAVGGSFIINDKITENEIEEEIKKVNLLMEKANKIES